MNKSTRQAENALWACFSYKGHDFDLKSPGVAKRHAKKMTRRARRRIDKALVQEG